MKNNNFALICLLFLSCLPMISFSQPAKQETELAIYNVSLGGLIGGLGACINNKKAATWYKTFVKGFIKGSIGGFLIYQSKRVVFQINNEEKLWYGWPAKLIHATGVSIVENSALNKNILDSWSMHLGFVRLQVNRVTPKLQTKFLPFAFSGFVLASFTGRLNLKKSLLSATPYFETNDLIRNRYDGSSNGNEIIINQNGIDKYHAIAHEYIHHFQFREYVSLNTFLQPMNKKLKTKTFYNNLSRYIYLDFPYNWLLYEIERNPEELCHFSNYFEFEAEFFSTLNSVRRLCR